MSSRSRGSAPRRVFLAALLAAASATLPAFAEDGFNPLGDGSDANNPDLFRDPTTGCENCLPNPPHEWDDPWVDLDWSLALRGAYVQATGGSYFEASAIPSLSLTHEYLRGSYAASASAEIVRSSVEDVRLAAARAALSGEYQVDEATLASGALSLALTRAGVNALGTSPTVALQPLVFTGSASGEIERDFAPFVITGSVDVSRGVYGPTTMVDTSTVDNSYSNNWAGGAGLRVGYRVTPILTAFVDGSVGHQWYDTISPTYGVKLNATDIEGRVGLSAKWNEVLEAEASVGYGLRRFDDAALGQSRSMLYDGSVTFRPDETLEIRGAFTTSFGAPGANSTGTARLEHAATGDLAYRVNPWLRLRASAGWTYAEILGTGGTERAYNVGVGADYLLNENATITGDYGYSARESSTSAPGDEHRVTLGITFSR